MQIKNDKKAGSLKYPLASVVKNTVKEPDINVNDSVSISQTESPPQTETPKDKGKLLIQIDGLSYDALKQAIDKGYAPNIKAMIEKENYALKCSLCGLPAVTYSIQSQLFYGVQLPGNHWYNKKEEHVVKGIDKEPMLGEGTKASPEGVLSRGSTFSSPLTGGADETAFTVTGIKKHPAKEFFSILRDLKEAKQEGEIATFPKLISKIVKDMKALKGKFKAKDIYRTFSDKRHPLGIAFNLSVFEPVVAHAIKEAIGKGSPVIYSNFDLYDTVAHYMGAQSEEAFEALKKLDTSIANLKKIAEESGQRDYNLTLFSDHGQTKAANFVKEFGKPIKEVILDFADEITKDPKGNEEDIAFVDVYSMGNLYFNSIDGTAKISDVKNKYPNLMKKIVDHPGVDMVAGREGNQVIIYGKDVNGKKGKVIIGNKIKIEGANPLAKYNDVGDIELVAKQIKEYMSIPETGDLVLFGGWKEKGLTYDFCSKNTFGSLHGGLGGAQSRPFLLANDEDPFDTSKVVNAKDLYPQLKEVTDETK